MFMTKTKEIFLFCARQIKCIKLLEKIRILTVTGFADNNHPITNEFSLKILRIEINENLYDHIQGFINLFLDEDGHRRLNEFKRMGYLVTDRAKPDDI